jgi:uncharacterized protein YutE (UPF0331/DUF86 family)
VGFRNVLVHHYIRVNDGIVVDRLKALGDLEDFVSQWQPSSPLPDPTRLVTD